MDPVTQELLDKMPDHRNGAIDKAITELKQERHTFVLPANVLRRVARLHARLEGANAVAQAAIDASHAAQAALQAALNEACEEEGMSIPQDGNTPVNIDWRTGRLNF